MSLILSLLLIVLVAGCARESGEAPVEGPRVERAPFGTTPEGQAVDVYTLTGAGGLEMHVITYGGIIQSLRVPDAEGRLADVVLGYDTLTPYVEANPYFGALIGRYGNRIDEGRFTLDGTTYTLATNNGPNHLHGGERGFDKVVWTAEPFEKGDAVGLVLRYTSADGEEGYPGRLEVRVTYTLAGDGTLAIDYHATTDEATPVNLTQHSYFNLAGHDAGPILDHRLMINAEAFTPVDSTLIPTGEIQPVGGTPFDFTEPTPIGARIDRDHRQLAYGQGYDHNFVLERDGGAEDSLVLAARVHDPASGRRMAVHTTEPGLQFYSGNFLEEMAGKDGATYDHRHGFCLETQHFPDAPNQPNFPSTILRPDETYTSRTVYSFTLQ